MVEFYKNTKEAYSSIKDSLKSLAATGKTAGVKELQELVYGKFGFGDKWFNKSIERLIGAKLVEKGIADDGEEILKWIGE